MSFDIDTVLGDMLVAVENSIDSDWDNVKGYAKQVLENEKETLAELAAQRISGDLTEEELKSEIRSTTEAELDGYELVEQWQDKKEYWIYYRLSKVKYQVAREEKVNRAIEKLKSRLDLKHIVSWSANAHIDSSVS